MPVVTLSTDIGHNDYIVGAIKGQLISVNPALNIVDITHNLSSDNFLQAAYICINAFKYYPAETIHIIIANLFEYRPTHMLIAEYGEQFIICPDNGLLTMITREKPTGVYSMPVDTSKPLNVLQCTESIAKAVSIIQQKAMAETAAPVTAFIEKYPLRSTANISLLESQIIFIDNFENVVVNITREEFEEYRKGRSFKIYLTRNEIIEAISENYSGVSQGSTLAWFNSAGYLELAINKGNLAGLFGLQGFSEKTQHAASVQNKLLYQVVRIYFE